MPATTLQFVSIWMPCHVIFSVNERQQMFSHLLFIQRTSSFWCLQMQMPKWLKRLTWMPVQCINLNFNVTHNADIPNNESNEYRSHTPFVCICFESSSFGESNRIYANSSACYHFNANHFCSRSSTVWTVECSRNIFNSLIYYSREVRI